MLPGTDEYSEAECTRVHASFTREYANPQPRAAAPLTDDDEWAEESEHGEPMQRVMDNDRLVTAGTDSRRQGHLC